MRTTKAGKERRSDKVIAFPETFEPLFWEDADGRNVVVKTIRKKYEQLKEDSGADSLQKEMICQRAVFLATRLESMEMVALDKGQADWGVYVQGVNSLVGLLKSLGLEKKAKQVNLSDYLEARK